MGGSGNWLTYLFENSLVLILVVGLFYALALVCAVREVTYSRTSQGSIAWLLSLLLLPFPTTLLYLIFGWKLFDDFAALQLRKGRANRVERTHEFSLRDEAAGANWKVLAGVSQLPFVAGNAAELLIDGEATFRSIFEGISRAKRYVFTQFYIIRDDRLGREFADRLIERARAGVAVYLLYDDVGCFWLPKAYLKRLTAAGVRVAAFNQRHKMLRFYGPARINYRNHRKIVVVDGLEAWVGGHNVGVEYLGEDSKLGKWRDTHVHISGGSAISCALVFGEDWNWATGEMPDAPPSSAVPPAGDQSILVMPSGPSDILEECAIAFSEVISRARKRLWVVSPYFVPDVDMQTALFAAALRGVDVRVLIPERPDHLLVWMASNAHAARMLDYDIAIYRYPEGFLHEKVILMDDEIAGVGTVNFDNRSFSINFEVTLWFTGARMIADVAAMLETDFAAAKRYTKADRDSVPAWRQFASQAARLFSPIL